MTRRLAILALLVATILVTVGLATVTAIQPQGQMLVKIALRSDADLARVESAKLPVFARLAGASEAYVLAGSGSLDLETLRTLDLEVTVLDPDTQDGRYFLVSWRGAPQPELAAEGIQVLLMDGVQTLVRCTPAGARWLAEAGYQLAALSLEPIALHPRLEPSLMAGIQPDPLVAEMVAQVDADTLFQLEAWLTGEEAVEIGGEPYTLVTRHTYSGSPIQKATQFAYEHLDSLGLQTTYFKWADATYPDVIATQAGLTSPEDVVILCAHLDDMPPGSVAPGADDNASGSAAVLAAAGILSQYDFDATLKYALWTGEEQGLLGSDAWAEWAASQEVHIVGVFNMDMIAYDSDAHPAVDLHARSWLPDSEAMARLFTNVVQAYELDLAPEVFVDHSLGNYSDNKSFWDEGYASILAIEDEDDFTPFYHTVNDRLATLNMAYFAEFAKASLATFAHMSGPLMNDNVGFLEGHVVVSDNRTPIAGASVSIRAKAGRTFLASTNNAGYYVRTLPVGTYDLTAFAPGYQPASVAGVVVLTSTVTTQDVALEPASAELPQLVLAPTSLEVVLQPGESITQTLWLTNTGEANLVFGLHEFRTSLTGLDYDIPWLAEEPTSGTLTPRASRSITIALAAEGLEPGLHQALLDVESNDPFSPHWLLPITLTVPAPCVPVHDAEFQWTPTKPSIGEVVTFTGMASGSAPITFTWDFGDEVAAIGETVTHVYRGTGDYTVFMTASNCGALPATVRHNIGPVYWRTYLSLVLHRR